MRESSFGRGWWTWFVAPTAVVVTALVTSRVRADMGLVNTGLALAFITTSVAIIDWRAGVFNSVVASLALNYFHTEPVHSFRVTSASDLWMVLLLCILGFSVSASSAFRWRRSVRAHHEAVSDRANLDLLVNAFTERPASGVWHDAIEALADGLALVTARLDTGTDEGLPRIARRTNGRHDTLVLPQCGAVVEFRDGLLGSRLILTPKPGVGPVEVKRDVVFAFADAVESTL